MTASPENPASRRQFWVAGAGGLLLLGGGAVMLGWLSRMPLWEYVFPKGTAMVFQTATCFVLAGIALLPSRDARRQRLISIAVGCIITAIALMALANAIFSISLGNDLSTLHRWYADNNPYPGRMAPNTAIALLLGGLAFIVDADDTRADAMFHTLPAAIVTLGVLGLAGYLLSLDLTYHGYNVPRMAASTAVCMIVFGTALLIERQTGGRAALADARAYAFLGAAIATLAMIAFISYGSIKALIERAAWVEHTGEVRIEFETMAALESRGYNAWRAFLVTGDQGEMRSAGARMLNHLRQLQRLTTDNPAQQGRLRAMQELIEANATLLGRADIDPTGNPRQAEARQSSLMANRERFNAFAAAFRAEENRLLTQRQQASQESVNATTWTILVGNAIGFVILFCAGWLLKRQNEQRDRLTAALESSNTFLDSLVEHIPNMVFVREPEQLRFVRFNKAGEEMIGFSREELLGKNVYDYFPRDEADFFMAKDRETLSGSSVVDIPEEPITTRHRGVRLIHTRKIPILDAQGRPQYLLGISEDITQRKQAEQEIAALNASLKARAAELEAANKELESFTYSVSHDLRAPLRAINGYAQMLEEDYRDRLDAGGQRQIAQIRAYTRQMGALIDDLLGLSRLGRQALRAIRVDCDELLREVLRTELGAWKGPSPEIRIDALPPASADPLLLRQVWANLVSNALKYSGKSAKPIIEISGKEENGEVVYCVKDNGVGFDMAYYDKLFNVFQRLHSGDEFPGTGVGLAIVQRIVTRHGGRAWALSKPGQGAEFFFSLPASDDEPRVHGI